MTFAAQLLDDKNSGQPAKASKYVNFIKDQYFKRDMDDEDVNNHDRSPRKVAHYQYFSGLNVKEAARMRMTV